MSKEERQVKWQGEGFEPTAEPKPTKSLTLFTKGIDGERSGRLEGDREARTAKIEVRCSDAERGAWQVRAQGSGFRSVSDWIRSKLNEADAPKSRAEHFAAAGVLTGSAAATQLAKLSKRAKTSKAKRAKKATKPKPAKRTPGRSLKMPPKKKAAKPAPKRKPAPKKKPAKKAAAKPRARK